MNQEDIEKRGEEAVRELLILTRENNDILRNINTQRKLGNIISIVKWIIITGLLFGAYQTIMPYYATLIDAANKINAITQNPSSAVTELKLDEVMLNQVKNTINRIK